MKKSKVSKIAALLAAGTLLLGGTFMSCSSGDDDDNTALLIALQQQEAKSQEQKVLAQIAGSYKFGDSTVEIKSDGTVTVTAADGTQTNGKASVSDDKLTITNENGTTLFTATVKDNEIDTSTVKDSAESEVEVSFVKMNGTAYSSIKAALEAIPADTKDTYTITLKKGTYSENYLHYNGSATVKIKGDTTAEYGADVIITGHGTNMGKEKGRELLEVEGSGNLILENITLLSDYSRKDVKSDAQAEVLGFDSTGTVAAYNCSFKSHQDTMRTTGKGWFYKCYVEGDTDFIWMESTGIVALYEECEIVSVYDEYASTHASYILAPRANVADSLGKGAVIYNSTVTLNNEDNYLFRNPWSTNNDYYNQGAFVDVTFTEDKTLNVKLAKSLAMGTDDQQYIGWKVDSTIAAIYPDKLSSIGTLSENVKSNEYSGRRAILNRNYSIKTSAFSKDVENYWNIDAFIKSQGWDVSADSSKELLEGETESTLTIYNLDTETIEDLTANGFALEAGKPHWVGQKDSTITFNVTGKCAVEVTGYYQGSGTIKAGEQGAANWNVTNGSTSKYLSKTYYVYNEGNSTVTITADETSYLTKITVTYDTAITFVPVSAINITTVDNAESVSGTKTLQFNAAVEPDNATNTDFTWSIAAGSDYATIDSEGLLTAEAVEAEQSVTVKATANDTNGVFAEKTITVVPLSANAFDITWLDNTEANLSATDSNAEVATGASAVTATSGTDSSGAAITGTWAYNGTKLDGQGITLTAADDDATPGEWYVEYPITAVQDLRINTIRIWWGNCGTSNLRFYVQYYKNDEAPIVLWDKRDKSYSPRTADNESSTVDVYQVLSAGDTAKISVSIHSHRLNNGEDAVQAIAGKSPTWGKTVISGEAGSFPVAGQTYTYNLCTAENLKNAGSTSDGLFSWSGSNSGSGHGLQAGSGTLKVAGNVKITVGLCKYGSGTITVKNGDTEVTSLTVEKMPSCYAKGISNPTFESTNSQSFTYTGSAAELSFEWSKNVYLEGIQVEPVSE